MLLTDPSIIDINISYPSTQRLSIHVHVAIATSAAMGSSASKTAKAAGSAARQYPNRPSGTTQRPAPTTTTNAPPPPPPPPAAQRQPGPTVKPQPYASGDRSEAINLDASDPDFAQSLRSIGPVQPNPTLSPTSAFTTQPGGARPHAPNPRNNPAITVLHSRAKLQEAADAEFEQAGIRGHQGRQFLDVYQIRQILQFRDERGMKHSEIERRLGLKEGAVARLGAAGVVELAQEQGRAERDIRMV
ncbi:hypothetical protein CLAFUW4_01356 [Fulvia fulva]|uniref:Helix-turn-helix domain-containing protein n=1 Tax=Passalora fulva TaxID=5499 RepID=A0A9Q8L6E7_PASFU|nr:uncharacterized protein CLAFUR5_01359 [Fulvia fulva]KAK4634745.1 hypothetical protein CLAFUR4_01357 [Fulvia fulva]KAK4637142.1 hypothetical protein CLAFUR0_01358 [Fulvia fulva]UJO11652.1 hypothetical protein CLAFUR5_01359 [Fulvia fulva]WPV10165.1 hypothetical protein CLAFUW4_01356 [Fulvia fulva]WPV23033.1 hypothetical protein CLAFUW7_01361 [Fulvia fulva]